MAGLIKLHNLPIIRKSAWNYVNSINTRLISTSKKNNETATCPPPPECKEKENWVSYGFSYTDKDEDTNAHHASYFFSITLCMVGGGFLWAYSPDSHLRDWAQREAFLELRRRESAGLPPVDPNLINPANINLPSDESICDIEIVI